MTESIICFRDTIDLVCVGLKENQEFMDSRAHEEGRKMLYDLGSWMTKRVFDAHQTHLGLSEVNINPYTSGWDCQLEELEMEFASVVSGSIVLTDHLKEWLGSLKAVQI